MSRVRVVAVAGNVTSPSRTRVLVQNIVDALGRRFEAEVEIIDLSAIGPLLGSSLSRKQLAPTAEAAVAAIEGADLIVATTPIYRGSYTGLFKHLFDFVGHEALVGKPVLFGATGGSERHSLAIDHQLRPLFAFFRAHSLPTGVYAIESDFDGYVLVNSAIHDRIEAAADEAKRFVEHHSRAARGIRAVA